MIKFEPGTSDFPEYQDDIASARDCDEDYSGVSEVPRCGNKSEQMWLSFANQDLSLGT